MECLGAQCLLAPPIGRAAERKWVRRKCKGEVDVYSIISRKLRQREKRILLNIKFASVDLTFLHDLFINDNAHTIAALVLKRHRSIMTTEKFECLK